MDKKKKTDIRPFTKQFFRGSRWVMVLGLIGTLLSSACALAVAWIIQLIIDYIAGYDIGFDLMDITLITCIGIGVFIAAYLMVSFSRPRFIARGIGQYKEYVFRELTKKNISAFSGENSSLYISALSNDANSIETGYLGNIFPIIENVLLFVGALTIMLVYSPLLTAISIGLSLLPVAASLLTGGLVVKAEKELSDRNEDYISTLRDSLSGFSVIKTFKAEAQMCRIFARNVRLLTEADSRKRKLEIIIQMFAQTAGMIAQMGVFLIGAYLAFSGKGVTVGTVMVFVQVMNYVLSPIAVIPGCIAQIKASKGLIRKLADALPENVRESGTVEELKLDDSISVENLSFAYEPEKPVLKNVDFTFEAGKSYALVGGSGSGKSTLLNLLMASYPGYTGAIRYDESELRDITSESLYELISVIQQNVFVFNASIRDNITMFSEFSKEAVDKAIELSGLSALIAEKGEDYLCGENGSGLSGGEKQRISIARSLLKNSQVLLVDEATAALDAQTAFQVSDSILNLDGITRIVVTHALDEALLRRYDCILTLKNGSIAESGGFDELMDKKGYFYSLYTVSQ
ncbi:MAG: ABC transporter ATP-binding protein [Ruminococcaceae bacterium]|nr:ABC transporter ATP-binding protein [Oscillospiraceae bacterium]